MHAISNYTQLIQGLDNDMAKQGMKDLQQLVDATTNTIIRDPDFMDWEVSLGMQQSTQMMQQVPRVQPVPRVQDAPNNPY